MRVISIVNFKGGVGKSMTAINLATLLAELHGQRVLLIDADAQGNSTGFFRVSTEGGGMTALLEGLATTPYDLIEHTAFAGLDMLPSDISLVTIDAISLPRREELTLEDVYALVSGVQHQSRALSDFCEALAEDDAYDIVLIDCPPSFSAACKSAIVASSEIIIPIRPGMFEFEGMAALTTQINGLRRIRPNIHIAGCLLTMWDTTDLTRQFETEIRKLMAGKVYKTKIRASNDPVTKSAAARVPVWQNSPTSSAGRDYKKFAEELLGGARNGAAK